MLLGHAMHGVSGAHVYMLRLTCTGVSCVDSMHMVFIFL